MVNLIQHIQDNISPLFKIDTSLTTYEIIDELYDKFGDNGMYSVMKEMQDILGDFAKS